MQASSPPQPYNHTLFFRHCLTGEGGQWEGVSCQVIPVSVIFSCSIPILLYYYYLGILFIIFAGFSSVLERYKGHSNKTLNNFLKAPPPPRNKSLKQGSAGHSMNHVENTLNNSRSTSLQGTTLQNKRTYLDSIGTTNSNGLTTSTYVKPDASSQAISDMGNIVANIETNVSGGHPLNLGHPLGVTVTKASIGPGPNLSIGGSNNLDSSLNLCSTLGINSGNVQGSISSSQTTFVAANAASMMTVASGSQISGVASVTGFTNVKEILPAPVAGKVAVGSVASTSASSPVYKGVQVGKREHNSTMREIFVKTVFTQGLLINFWALCIVQIKTHPPPPTHQCKM